MKLADKATSDFMQVHINQTVAEALGAAASAEWMVIIDEGNAPIGLVTVDSLRAVDQQQSMEEIADTLPPLITFPAEYEVREAVRSRVVDDLSIQAAGALIRRGDQIVGVWPEADLAEAIAAFGLTERSMSAGDTELPGTINIPVITRLCQFQQGRQKCHSSVSFSEKPDQFGPCLNPKNLEPHFFVW